MPLIDEALVAAEIHALHHEFEQWFHGRSSTLDRVDRVLADVFCFVSPGGQVVARGPLMDGLRSARGSGEFTISIDGVAVAWVRGDLVAATYREHHHHQSYATTRQSTAVLEAAPDLPGGLRWLSVHETWLKAPPPPPG